jgi:hypothetical protein
MNVPPDARILAAITTGSVYYFEEEHLSSAEPHFFVVLNKNPRTDEFLFLVVASSQVGKRIDVARRLNFSPDTQVVIPLGEYAHFTKDTVIDCNTVFEKTTLYLIEKLKQGQLVPCRETMPGAVVKKLIIGVLASNQVEKRIKDALSG